MSTVAVSIRGKVRELGYDRIPQLFEKNQTGQYSISDRTGTLPALRKLHDGLSCGSGGKKVKFNA